MSRGIFQLRFSGRFGNQCFEYVFARAYAEFHDLELQTDPWVGEKIFEIEHPRCVGDLPRRDENTLRIGERNVSYLSYSQRQHCADYYSLTQIGKWFQFREDVKMALDSLWGTYPSPDFTVHLRRGDYKNSIYPLVSGQSYLQAIVLLDPIGDTQVAWHSEEQPLRHPDFVGELSFVPDFYFMTKAKNLMRANSSFSFWAGCLAIAHNQARVYSPIITGKTGGVDHQCSFQPDNWARIAELDCVDQITIKP
jgi:hypothetical protein